MYKWCFVPFLFLLLLAGCDGKSENLFYEKIHNVETFIEKSDWNEAKNEVNTIESLYNKQKWKLQLLGDEMEYEGVNQEIKKLSATIEEKDKTQAKICTSSLKTYLQSIYSL